MEKTPKDNRDKLWKTIEANIQERGNKFANTTKMKERQIYLYRTIIKLTSISSLALGTGIKRKKLTPSDS